MALGVGAVATSSAHASAVQATHATKVVAKPVTVTLPSKTEDDESRYVAIYGGWAYVTVKGVTVKIGPAGPKSHGDYYKGAWHLVIIPPVK
jgi:hypothetical protein